MTAQPNQPEPVISKTQKELEEKVFGILTELIEQTNGIMGYGRFRKEATQQITDLIRKTCIESLPKKVNGARRAYTAGKIDWNEYQRAESYNQAIDDTRAELERLLGGKDA